MAEEYVLPAVGEAMHNALRRRPFEPFWIVLHDGRKFLVHRLMQAGLNQTTVLFQPDDALSIRFRIDEVEGIYSAEPSKKVG